MSHSPAGGNGSRGSSHGTANVPPFIMDDVRLLFSDLTTPETQVKFSPPARANPSTIENAIQPPQATWTWADQVARLAQQVSQADLGKYGLQRDISTLYRLVSLSPLRWELVRDFTTASWTWQNVTARDAEKVTADDVGKIGYQADTNTYYRLTGTAPAVWQHVPAPSSTSPPFELSTGAADAESYHDFFRLQIAFEDVWAELLDQTIDSAGKQAYALWDALMDQGPDSSHDKDRQKKFHQAPKGDITGVDELNKFLDNLRIQLGITAAAPVSTVPLEITQLRDAVADTLKGCNMLLTELNRVGTNIKIPAWEHGDLWLASKAGQNDNPQSPDDLRYFPGIKRGDIFDTILNRVQSLTPSQPPAGPAAPEVTFPDLSKLLRELDRSLREKYRFDVFAPASINYGLLLNYRQHWQPQSYQVGNLVSTIPLAPQETRRYTTKTVVKQTRNVKEISDSVRSGKDESVGTWRVDAEIVDRAKNQTSFQANAAGSYGNDNLYKISAGMQQAKTRRWNRRKRSASSMSRSSSPRRNTETNTGWKSRPRRPARTRPPASGRSAIPTTSSRSLTSSTSCNAATWWTSRSTRPRRSSWSRMTSPPRMKSIRGGSCGMTGSSSGRSWMIPSCPRWNISLPTTPERNWPCRRWAWRSSSRSPSSTGSPGRFRPPASRWTPRCSACRPARARRCRTSNIKRSAPWSNHSSTR